MDKIDIRLRILDMVTSRHAIAIQPADVIAIAKLYEDFVISSDKSELSDPTDTGKDQSLDSSTKSKNKPRK